MARFLRVFPRLIIVASIYVLIGISKLQVNADLHIVPEWNNNHNSFCHLSRNIIDGRSMWSFIGHSSVPCSIYIETTMELSIHVHMPQSVSPNTFIYVEKLGNILSCQNKYVVITADEPCDTFFSDSKLQLYLFGSTTVLISDISINRSSADCLKPIIKYSKMPDTHFCITKEFNDSISCVLSSDQQVCSFELLSDCYVTLGSRYVEFKCPGEATHTALIIYPFLNFIRELYLSDQDIAEISGYAFIGISTLTKLDLSHNKILKLHPLAFNGLTLLHMLYMQGNEIRSLDTYIFDGLFFLSILNLAENKLSAVPSELFRNLMDLKFLNASNNQIIKLDGHLFNENRKLTSLTIKNNNLTLVARGIFKGLQRLESLSFSENQIRVLNGDLFNETMKLNYLTISRNKLTLLPKGLFKGLLNLEKLFLSENQIYILEGDLFNETRKLIYLDIDQNKLTYLPSGIFKGLINLKKLRLHENQIKIINGDLFNETRNLNYLNIRDNRLLLLPSGIFKGLMKLEKLHLSRNQIQVLEEDLFNETSKLTYLTISSNNLLHLPSGLFHGLYNLKQLFFHENNLTSLDAALFQGLHNLRVLMIHTNIFTEIGFESLWDLKMLEYVGASRNQITHLDVRTFQGLINLQILTLRFNLLRYLDTHIFKDNINLTFLDLSGNQLTQIPSIYHLNKLVYFNLLSNKMSMINKHTFKYLPKQIELVVNQTEICECYVANDIKCIAVNKRSPYLTCQRLLSDRVLMVMMWLIGFNALGGNLFVLYRNKQEKSTIQTFLLGNLAISDLLMGIYMLIIASADIYFGENFPIQAETWRSGVTCRIASAMSIISSEASVLFLTLITIDRFINIRFPYSQRKLRKQSSAVIAALVWLTSLAMGILPAVLAGQNYKFYDNSHVCIGLPLAQIEMFLKDVTIESISRGGYYNSKYIVTSESLGYVSGLYYASAVFLGLNGICFIVILLCYIEIIRYTIDSSKKVGLKKDTKDEIRMTIKVAAIVLTDFFCWCPIIVLGTLVQLKVLMLPPSVFAWCVTVVLPINSAINPYLYTIVAFISNRRKQK